MDHEFVDISRELIENYKNLILKWNDKINLISTHTVKDFSSRHVLEALQLLKFIENKDIRLIDIGSGAGLPGIILSIAGIKTVTLVEANIKKATFLLEAASTLPNKVEVINERSEKLRLECDILTARALSSLSNLFKMTKNIKVKNKLLLFKGSKYLEELKITQQKWSFDYVIHDNITCKFGKILEIKNLCPK